MLNWEEEEEKDIEAVKICCQKYEELFQFLFARYSSKKGSNRNDIAKTLKVGDVARMMEEGGVSPKTLSLLEVNLSKIISRFQWCTNA